MKFYWLEHSFRDHPNKFSLILYTSWCNLKCMWCHNRKLSGWDYDWNRIVKSDVKFKELHDYDLKLALNNPVLDLIILCGWEFLMHWLDNINETLVKIKSIRPDVPIRIDTNGTFPDKVIYLRNIGLVDWFAIDIKWPYWDSEFNKEMAKVLWIPKKNIFDIRNLIIKSIKVADWMPYTIYRTVKYPWISKEYFDSISMRVKQLKSYHSFNKFINI